MKKLERTEALESEHAPHAIRERIQRGGEHSYLRDAVLGGIDGCVTTFAVVAGATGGSLDNTTVVILGMANLLADGLSMAASNFMGTRVEAEQLKMARRLEQQHIEVIPEGESAEIREIYAQKGFHGPVLDQVVDTITGDPQVWVDTMLTEELSLRVEHTSPWKAALATFAAFLGIGLIPLVPYLVSIVPRESIFPASSVLTAMGFALVGAAKGVVMKRRVVRSAVETLLIGGAAAAVAYAVGFLLRSTVGTA